ncbi:hypothetical protein BC940DRAFT_321043 [Gongronella butleri]|nr:hypothetical protein BC940DRAFT_321043 [Gongronella butleri]
MDTEDADDDARSEDTADVTQLSPMMIAPDMYIPEIAVEVEVAAVDMRQERDYNEAIIYACYAVDRPDTHQQMIKLVDAMNPQPFSVFCADDLEHNGLAHQIIIHKATVILLLSDHCELANCYWQFHPQSKFVVAQLFSGAILFRSDTHQAVLVHAVEAYGRDKTIDATENHLVWSKASQFKHRFPLHLALTIKTPRRPPASFWARIA